MGSHLRKRVKNCEMMKVFICGLGAEATRCSCKVVLVCRIALLSLLWSNCMGRYTWCSCPSGYVARYTSALACECHRHYPHTHYPHTHTPHWHLLLMPFPSAPRACPTYCMRGFGMADLSVIVSAAPSQAHNRKTHPSNAISGQWQRAPSDRGGTDICSGGPSGGTNSSRYRPTPRTDRC